MRQFLKDRMWLVALLVPLVFTVIYLLSCLLLPFVNSLAATIMMDTTLMLAGIGIMRWLGLTPERRIKVELWQVVLMCVGVCVFYISMALLANAVYVTFGDTLFDAYTEGRADMSEMNQLFTLFATTISAPVSEECIFRGAMYGALRRTRLPKFIGALIASSVFALAHGTLVHLAPALVMGLLCAGIYEFTGKLRYAVLTHIVYNVMSFFAAGIAVPEFFGTWFAVVAQTVVWLGVIGAMFFLADRRRPAEQQVEE